MLPVVNDGSRSLPSILNDIQRYMNELQYNHTGTQFYEIKKNRPVSRCVGCAIVIATLPPYFCKLDICKEFKSIN